jgi:hypothetical protein
MRNLAFVFSKQPECNFFMSQIRALHLTGVGRDIDGLLTDMRKPWLNKTATFGYVTRANAP